jgi:hypothetical protein
MTHFCKYWYVYRKASFVKLKFPSSSISDALAMSNRGACASNFTLRSTVHQNKKVGEINTTHKLKFSPYHLLIQL